MCWSTLGLFISFVYCEKCSSEHLCTNKYLFESLLPVLLSIYLEVELLVVLCLTSSGTTKLFRTASFYIPIGYVQGFQFLHIITKTYFPFLLNYKHPSRYEVVLGCISLMTDDGWAPFHVLIQLPSFVNKCLLEHSFTRLFIYCWLCFHQKDCIAASVKCLTNISPSKRRFANSHVSP